MIRKLNDKMGADRRCNIKQETFLSPLLLLLLLLLHFRKQLYPAAGQYAIDLLQMLQFCPFLAILLQIVQICDICTRSQSDQVRVIWWSRSRKLTSSRRQFATVCIIKPQLYCVTGLWTISLINQLGPAPKDRA